MAAVIHGCGSPRQHSGSNISGVSSCVTGTHHQYQTTTPMYPVIPKYNRTSPQQLTASNLHHAYGGNSTSTSGMQYNSTLPPPVSYMPMSAAPQHHNMQSGYGTTQRPATASAATDQCRNYWGHQHAATMMYRAGRHQSKRKSAVELLAETKPFFIRSDVVMERLQQSGYRNINIPTGTKRGRNSIDGGRIEDGSRCNPAYAEVGHVIDMERRFSASNHMHPGSRNSHLHHHHHHGGHHPHTGRHSSSTNTANNSLLQSKLRVLLASDSIKDRGTSGRSNNERFRNELTQQFDYASKTLPPIPFSGGEDSALRIPPPSFLSPQPFDSVFNYGAETSSGDEPLVLTENYRPISPPAEYAADSNHTNNEQRARYNYQRSYSHSHEMAAENVKYTAPAYNINSHKSLPDLHSQISRHSPHSEILSCCSRGNRSIKSAGESSLNRDSGGSSGHYTHRSEPCYRQQRDSVSGDIYDNKSCTCCNPPNKIPMEYRRDSGSSTQHSANSYCGYTSYPTRTADCVECRCKNMSPYDSADYLLNFTTPEVPEAFQDDYTPPSPAVNKFKTDERRYSNSSNQQLLCSQIYASGMKHSQNSIVQSPGSAPSVDDISPPPIQFKRQKCIRFKNRNRVIISNVAQVRSTEVNHSPNLEQPTFVFPKCFPADGYQPQEKTTTIEQPPVSMTFTASEMEHLRESENVADLEKFFDRLGLNDEKFHEIYSPPKRRHSNGTESDDSSTVFFSDVSTVDSMRLPDSTETQPQTTQPYRPSEPPSIVERNARIIKWLCNCRKQQYI